MLLSAICKTLHTTNLHPYSSHKSGNILLSNYSFFLNHYLPVPLKSMMLLLVYMFLYMTFFVPSGDLPNEMIHFSLYH
jgi:hypothetical protein